MIERFAAFDQMSDGLSVFQRLAQLFQFDLFGRETVLFGSIRKRLNLETGFGRARQNVQLIVDDETLLAGRETENEALVEARLRLSMRFRAIASVNVHGQRVELLE